MKDFIMKTSATYNRVFWNVMRGNNESRQNLVEGYDDAGSNIAPSEFIENLNLALVKENLFR